MIARVSTYAGEYSSSLLWLFRWLQIELKIHQLLVLLSQWNPPPPFPIEFMCMEIICRAQQDSEAPFGSNFILPKQQPCILAIYSISSDNLQEGEWMIEGRQVYT